MTMNDAKLAAATVGAMRLPGGVSCRVRVVRRDGLGWIAVATLETPSGDFQRLSVERHPDAGTLRYIAEVAARMAAGVPSGVAVEVDGMAEAECPPAPWLVGTLRDVRAYPASPEAKRRLLGLLSSVEIEGLPRPSISGASSALFARWACANRTVAVSAWSDGEYGLACQEAAAKPHEYPFSDDTLLWGISQTRSALNWCFSGYVDVTTKEDMFALCEVRR